MRRRRTPVTRRQRAAAEINEGPCTQCRAVVSVFGFRRAWISIRAAIRHVTNAGPVAHRSHRYDREGKGPQSIISA